MKKNAFTLIELLAVIVIFGILSTVAVISYNKYIDSSRVKSYEDAESTMIAASKSLLTYCMTSTLPNDACKVIPSIGETLDINLTELTENGFMKDVKDQGAGGGCTGYVRVSNLEETEEDNNISDNYNLKYKVCLICSDYESAGCNE